MTNVITFILMKIKIRWRDFIDCRYDEMVVNVLNEFSDKIFVLK